MLTSVRQHCRLRGAMLEIMRLKVPEEPYPHKKQETVLHLVTH